MTRVAVAIVETDEVAGVVAVPRARLSAHIAACVPPEASLVILCPFGDGPRIERGIREVEANLVLQRMEPHGQVS